MIPRILIALLITWAVLLTNPAYADLPTPEITNQIPERKVPERKVPERKVPERKVPERKIPERKIPERKIPERKIPEKPEPVIQDRGPRDPHVHVPEGPRDSPVAEPKPPGSQRSPTAAQNTGDMSIRVSKETASALAAIFAEHKRVAQQTDDVLQLGILVRIYDWITSFGFPDITGDGLVEIAAISNKANDEWRVEVLRRLADLRLRLATKSTPRADRDAVRLLYELLFRPDAFKKGSFEIDGNRIRFYDVPFKRNERHVIEVPPPLARAVLDRLNHHLRDPAAPPEFVYLAVSSPWEAKLRAAASSNQVSAINFSDQEVQMMRAALYNMRVENVLYWAMWVQAQRTKYPSHTTFLDAIDTAPGWSNGGMLVQYSYP